MMLRRLLIVILVCAAAAQVYSLEVGETVWGFNGKAVPGRMNILSVLVTHYEARPFEGILVLERGDGLGDRRGAKLVEPVFLAPGQSRWVQFCVHIQDTYSDWTLSWGPGPRSRIKLPKFTLSAPVTVFLDNREKVTGGKSKLKKFPVRLFPPTVTATDGLESVIIDHAPSWEKYQRQAFIDWLARGGTLHLLHTDRKEYPWFKGDLTFLNGTEDTSLFGAGTIVRHPVTAPECTESYLSEKGYPPLALSEETYSGMTFDKSTLQSMSNFGQGRHSWGLIYTMVVFYILLIGPVNYFIGRKAKKYYAAIISFILIITVFTLIFMSIGKAGYTRISKARSITYAKMMSSGEYDVTQWFSVFAAKGDYYTFVFPTPFSQFSTCQDYEQVNGVIKNGLGGQFRVDIPVFSKRGFLRRGRISLSDGVPFRITAVDADSAMIRKLDLTGGLGSSAKVETAWAFYSGKFYRLKWSGSNYTLASTGDDISTFFEKTEFDDYYQYGSYYEDENTEFSVHAGKMGKQLIARALGGCGRLDHNWEGRDAEGKRVHVFLFSSSSDELKLNHPVFTDETGYMLIHMIFPIETKE